MAGKTKKDINDPEFFEDAHLDEVGEPAGIIIPDDDTIDAEDAADDVVDDADEGDEPSDADDDASAEDDEVGDDANPVGGADDGIPPHVADLDLPTMQKVYGDVRNLANAKIQENRRLTERNAELEASLAEFYGQDDPAPAPAAPAYDSAAFAQQAANDPRAAFDYALQGGQHSDAQAAIARVQSDASELAAMAALARSQQDADSWAHYNAAAINANAQAQEMQGELSQRIVEDRNRPLVEETRRRNLTIAEQALNEQTGGAYAQHRMATIQVMQRSPQYAAGTSLEEVYAGLRDAYAIAQFNAPAAAPVQATEAAPVDVDAIAKQAVAKHLAATRQAKKDAAEAASGGDTGRGAPAGAGGGEPSEKDAIYQHAKAQSMGARAFMDL